MHLFKRIVDVIRSIDLFSLGAAVSVYFLVFYYLTPLLSIFGITFNFLPDIPPFPWGALVVATVGFIAMLAGYFSPIGKKIALKTPNIFGGPWRIHRAEIVFWTVFAGGLFAKTIRIFGGGYGHLTKTADFVKNPFSGAVGFLDLFAYIAIALAFVMYYSQKERGEPFRRWQIYAWAVLALELLYAFPTCTRLKIIIPLAIVLVVRSYLVRFDWRFVVSFALFIILIFPLGSACNNVNVLARHGVLGNGSVNVEKAGEFVGHAFLSRVSQIYLLSAVINADLPKLNGRPFLDFFISLGPPRFLWQSKPALGYDGNEFGRRIGVLAPDNTNTFVGPTLVGDWYINFGVGGVAIGMFIMGTLWRFIYDYLIVKSGPSLSGVLIYSLILPQIIRGLEDSFTLVYAGLVKFLIVLILIHYFLRDNPQ